MFPPTPASRLTVLVAAVALFASCASDDPTIGAWCARVAAGDMVALDAVDAPERWSRLEAEAPPDLVGDAERVRVAAQQVAGSDPADHEAVARLALAPRVVEAHGRLVSAAAASCGIDVSTFTVIDRRS